MDPMSQIVAISIGNVVTWLAAIYLRDALHGLLGNVAVGMTGAIIAALLSQGLPPRNLPAMILAAFLGAAALLRILLPLTRQTFRNGR